MQKLWICLLIITALVTVGFSIKTSLQLQEYFSLDRKTEALSTQWKILEKDEASFALQVSYSFLAPEKGPFQGTLQLPKPYFLNLPSAERAMKEFSQKRWDVHYSQDNPSVSSLQKNFPFKDCIQSLLTLGVFVYFLFLKRMIEKSAEEW